MKRLAVNLLDCSWPLPRQADGSFCTIPPETLRFTPLKTQILCPPTDWTGHHCILRRVRCSHCADERRARYPRRPPEPHQLVQVRALSCPQRPVPPHTPRATRTLLCSPRLLYCFLHSSNVAPFFSSRLHNQRISTALLCSALHCSALHSDSVRFGAPRLFTFAWQLLALLLASAGCALLRQPVDALRSALATAPKLGAALTLTLPAAVQTSTVASGSAAVALLASAVDVARKVSSQVKPCRISCPPVSTPLPSL